MGPNLTRETDIDFEEIPPSVSELFHENSKQQRYDLEFGRRISAVNNSPELHQLIAGAFKTYAGAAIFALPEVQPAEGLSFEEVVVQRRSVRDFTGEPLTPHEIARLLYFGNGITGQLAPSEHGIIQPVRAAPSGGGLYPVELYAVLPGGGAIEAGLYHYAVERHGLESLRSGDFTQALADATSYGSIFAKAGMTLILTLMAGRTRFKYGERGYRFLLLEAGHIAQNILLAATALGLGAVAVGGFIDDEINTLLDLDGVDEASIYLIAVGRQAASAVNPAAVEAQTMVDTLLSMWWEPAGPPDSLVAVASPDVAEADRPESPVLNVV